MEPSLTAKLALGTVQFGLDYGIKNPRGRVPENEVAAILKLAATAGVRMLDTSSAYGSAEEVLGRVLAGGTECFDLVSKLAKGAVEGIDRQIELTYRRLGVQQLYGYLCHHFDFYLAQPAVWERLRRLKVDGRVRKIGFSLYHPAEVKTLFDQGVTPDIIQVPYSVLDRRFEPLLAECGRRGIEVHVRSIFLQGLLLCAPEAVPVHFQPLRNRIAKLRDASEAAGVTPAQLLLVWTCQRPGISRVVIGVDSQADLELNLAAADLAERVRPHLAALDEMSEADERLILPTHWPK